MLLDLDRPLKSVMFGRVMQPTGFWHTGRSLTANLLVYMLEGQLRMRIDRTVYTAHAGDILLVPAGTSYAPLESDGCQYYFWHFFADFAEKDNAGPSTESSRELLQSGYVSQYAVSPTVLCLAAFFPCADEQGAEAIFRRAVCLNAWQSRWEKYLLDNLLRELLITLSIPHRTDTPTDRNVQKITEYINRHFREDISITVLAERFSLSKSYIARIFKRAHHMGTVAYINRMRLQAAAELLLATELPIGMIAVQCGYANVYYFNRLFRRLYRMTPGEFRQSGYSERTQ